MLETRWFSSMTGAIRPTCRLATIRVMTGRPAYATVAIQTTAAVVPTHYAAEERIARALERLGKPAATQLIIDSLPRTPQIRSGDLGEIYATEWINAHSGYRAPIKRLRWKDHRNMAMRGDDVIGLILDPATHRVRFLKTETKAMWIDFAQQFLTREDRTWVERNYRANAQWYGVPAPPGAPLFLHHWNGQPLILSADGTALGLLNHPLSPNRRGVVRATASMEPGVLDVSYLGPNDLWVV